jgi:hypothetical protein
LPAFAVAQDLPATLTRLQLTWFGSVTLEFNTARSIAQLTALRSLILQSDGQDGNISPILVQHMQQLTELCMASIAGDEGGLLLLLGALQSMQQMRHLELHFADDMYPLEDDEMQQYAALTASSQLTCFKLLHDNDAVAYGAAHVCRRQAAPAP